jgi:hypothetical protein
MTGLIQAGFFGFPGLIQAGLFWLSWLDTGRFILAFLA